mmetsp:Transcript_35985/g.48640  ORF Transcript_35985/g.48640 Transcript_35985/m.48640 type:complete len:283 (-) Transcript_35985:1275-2123(-)
MCPRRASNSCCRELRRSLADAPVSLSYAFRSGKYATSLYTPSHSLLSTAASGNDLGCSITSSSAATRALAAPSSSSSNFWSAGVFRRFFFFPFSGCLKGCLFASCCSSRTISVLTSPSAFPSSDSTSLALATFGSTVEGRGRAFFTAPLRRASCLSFSIAFALASLAPISSASSTIVAPSASFASGCTSGTSISYWYWGSGKAPRPICSWAFCRCAAPASIFVTSFTPSSSRSGVLKGVAPPPPPGVRCGVLPPVLLIGVPRSGVAPDMLAGVIRLFGVTSS